MISVTESNNISEFGFISQMYPAGAFYAPILETASHVQAASPGDHKKTRKRRIRKKSKACSNMVDNSEDGGGFKKRKLTDEQMRLLELNFGDEHKLESERKDRLAKELGLDPRQVAVWFQNRRARWKIKKLEEEYSKLKAAHDTLVLRNCQLESHVLKLEELLSAEENEVRRLWSEGTSSYSPKSCLSMEQAMDDGLLTNVFYNIPGNNYVPGLMEWSDLYHM